MKKFVILFLIIYPVILTGQARTLSNVPASLNPGNVTVNIFVEGYNPKTDAFRYLKLNYFSVYNGITTTIPCELDSGGKSSVTFPLVLPQEIMLLIDGSYSMMYAVPGQTENVYFDLAAFKAGKKLSAGETGTTFLSLRFSGGLSHFNQYLNAFWPKLPAIIPYDNQKRMIDSLEQSAYKSWRLAVMKRMLDTLDVFNRNQRTSNDFRQAMSQHIHYWAAEDLVRYGWLHRQGKREPLTKEYFDFLKEIPINNTKALVTGKYAAFLREYFEMWMGRWQLIPIDVTDAQLYAFLETNAGPVSQEDKRALKMPKASRNPPQEALVSQLYSLYEVNYKNFRNNLNIQTWLARELPPGIGTDILLARVISNYLNQFRQPLLPQNMQLMTRHIGNQPVCALVKQDNEQLKQELAGTFSHEGNQGRFKLQQEQLYQKLVTRYSGKVIYIDFWAPWCGPCMGEMPASIAMAKELKGKDIVFLYVGVECDQNLWDTTVKRMFDGGEHYYADKNESVLLEAKFNFSGIPRYVLIDKKGAVSDDNAPAPGRSAILKSKIDILLENNQ